jgi:hypothetical protein
MIDFLWRPKSVDAEPSHPMKHIKLRLFASLDNWRYLHVPVVCIESGDLALALTD